MFYSQASPQGVTLDYCVLQLNVLIRLVPDVEGFLPAVVEI